MNKKEEGKQELDINSELKKLITLSEEEQDKVIEDIANKTGKKTKRLRQQLDNFIEDDEEEKASETTAKEILMAQKEIEEISSYNEGINWADEEYYKDSWKRVKKKNTYQLKKSEDKMFQIFPSGHSISGKPQLLDNENMTPITLISKAVKKNKDGDINTSYKFVDDPYNRRDDGQEEDILEENFWVYSVTSDGIKYLVMCKEKLQNHEVHNFYGADIRVPHKKEFDKNLSCRGSANLFFCKESESTIKPRKKEELIPYIQDFIKETGFSKEDYSAIMKDYIFTHENGYIYNQPEEYSVMRHAQLLSGKSDGYPLHLFVWSGFGGGKTQELECLDNIFDEGILEAANSTPKSLVPSFSGSIPDPGFLLKSNRVALVDELMKMIDNSINNSRGMTDVKNQLSNLNFIFEHRKRKANSGNGGIYCMPTMKTVMMMNPSLKSNYIHEELEVLDPSTMSRILPFVKTKKHLDFIVNNKLSKMCEQVGLIQYEKRMKEKAIRSKVPVIAQRLRDFYVTIYDSCQVFNTFSNQGFLEFSEKLKFVAHSLAKNPMKTVWERRGLHHTKLLLDGIIKYRCLFKDVTDNFEPTQEDYDMCEKILIEMVQGWNENMGIKDNNESSFTPSHIIPSDDYIKTQKMEQETL